MDDTISRQAAIDTVHHAVFEFFDICEDDEESPMTEKDKMLLTLNKVISTRIKTIPSEEPQHELTEEDVREYCNQRSLMLVTSDFYDEMMKRWSSAEPKWIPVTERLPDFGVYVLLNEGCSYAFGYLIKTTEDKCEWGVNGWFNNLEDWSAWMPLPEPYCGSEMVKGEDYAETD